MSSITVRSALLIIATSILGAALSSRCAAQRDHTLEAIPGIQPRAQMALMGDGNLAALSFGRRARLGVVIEPTADGLKVSEVQAGSLAENAGVQAGDLIHRIGKTRIANVGNVAAALAHTQTGDEVTLAVIRDGVGLVEITGTLPEAPEPEQVQLASSGGAMLGVDLDEEDGKVIIAGVVENSAAWFAGVQKGDTLLSLDGTSVATPDDVVAFVGEHGTGDFVALSVERDGQQHDLRARLGARHSANRLLRFTSPGAFQFGWDHDGLRRMPLHRRGGKLPRGIIGHDGNMFRFNGDDIDGMHGLHSWLESLHEDGVFTGGEHEVRIEIQDGEMIIERDGEVETYKLKELNDGQFLRPHGGHDSDSEPSKSPKSRKVSWNTGSQDV